MLKRILGTVAFIGVVWTGNIFLQVHTLQSSVERQNSAIWPAIKAFTPSRNFTAEEESGKVTSRVIPVKYQAQPGILTASDNLSGGSPPTCPNNIAGKPAFIRLGAGGYAENRRILYVNPTGPWFELLSKLDITTTNAEGRRHIDTQKVQLWYSFANWHELGHAFQSNLNGTPRTKQFELCATPDQKGPASATGLLNREAGADIFALIGLFRDEKDPSPGTRVWPSGLTHEQFLATLIKEREQEPSADHRTDPVLRCVNLGALENLTGVEKPEEQANRAFLELAAASERVQQHDPTCRQ